MKGLKKIPNEKTRLVAYKALQFFPESVHIKDLVLWSQWARMDPRLGEILVKHLAKNWQNINPIQLNTKLKQCVWPSAFGVLLEHIPLYNSQYGSKKTTDKKLFFYWSKCSMTNIQLAPNEQFFIGLYKPGGKLMKEECFYSIKPYRKWGYFAKDLLLNKARVFQKTLIPLSQRTALIDELIKTRKQITTQDYLEKINFKIHRRQAQRDLKNHKNLRAKGNTNNRYYNVINNH